MFACEKGDLFFPILSCFPMIARGVFFSIPFVAMVLLSPWVFFDEVLTSANRSEVLTSVCGSILVC